MVIVQSHGDPINNKIRAKLMFEGVSISGKNPGLGKQVDQARINKLTRPG